MSKPDNPDPETRQLEDKHRIQTLLDPLSGDNGPGAQFNTENKKEHQCKSQH